MLRKVFILIVLLLINRVAPVFAAEYTQKKETMNFLSLADIHFDPFVSCTTIKPCPLIVKLQHAPATDWPALFAKYDTHPPQYRLDTNYPLLISALAASSQASQIKQAKFVLVLGDFLGHHFKHYYKVYSDDKTLSGYTSFIHKTLTFLTNELSKAFPSLNVYSVVGNNDYYQDDYVTIPNGAFFRDTGLLWSSLIKQQANRLEMQKQFRKAGYYAMTLPNQPDLCLIVLNTNVFSYKAKGENINQTAMQQLDWLHAQLQAAQNKKQTVLIAMHIPIGVDIYASLRFKLFTLIEFWKPTYLQRFQNELQQFAPSIAGIFAGHLHSDWFQILTFSSGEIPVTGTPSISPIFGNNPGFKLYSYSPASRQLEDYITYYYPLSTTQTWDLEYDFNLIYQTQCHHCPVIDGMSAIRPRGMLANFYKWFYAVSTTSQPITRKWNPYYWCAIWDVNAQDYRQCIE